MPSSSKLSPQARQARAWRLAQLKKVWEQEQPERMRRAQEQWRQVLLELEKQPEWVQLKSQEQLRQVQQEQTRELSATRESSIIALLSYFLCERAREEWLGDLRESRKRWQKQGLTAWVINLRTLRAVLRLLLDQLCCIDQVSDQYRGKQL